MLTEYVSDEQWKKEAVYEVGDVVYNTRTVSGDKGIYSIALTIGNWKPAKNCANVQSSKLNGKMLMQILLRKSSIMLLKFSA